MGLLSSFVRIVSAIIIVGLELVRQFTSTDCPHAPRPVASPFARCFTRVGVVGSVSAPIDAGRLDSQIEGPVFAKK